MQHIIKQFKDDEESTSKGQDTKEYETEQELINEACAQYTERLLGESTEINVELAEVLFEIDQAIKEYKRDNEDLRRKIWVAIKRLEEKDGEVTNLEDDMNKRKDEIRKLKDTLKQTTKELNQTFKSKEEEWLMKENEYKEEIKGYEEDLQHLVSQLVELGADFT